MKKSKVKEKKKIRKRKQGINVIQVISVLFIIYFVYTLYDQQIKINKYDSQIEMYEADIKNNVSNTSFNDFSLILIVNVEFKDHAVCSV